MTSQSLRTLLTAAAAVLAALYAVLPVESRAQNPHASAVLNMSRGSGPGEFAPRKLDVGARARPSPEARAEAGWVARGAPNDRVLSWPGGPQLPHPRHAGAFTISPSGSTSAATNG